MTPKLIRKSDQSSLFESVWDNDVKFRFRNIGFGIAIRISWIFWRCRIGIGIKLKTKFTGRN